MSITDTSDLQALKTQKKKIEASGRIHWFHWCIIVASLIFTVTAWYIAQSQNDRQIEIQYERESGRAVQLLSERMKKYEDTLASAAAFIQAKGSNTDTELWRKYSEALDIENKYPGINGIGIIYNIQPDQRGTYEAFMQKDRPNFRVFPEHNQSELFPITYIEPVEANAAAVGLDIAHETNRYVAAKKARDTGTAQITGPIILVQDSKKTPGFLFYQPFYKNRDSDIMENSLEKNLGGLVYAPFIVQSLMDGTLGRTQRHVDLRVIDDGQVLFDEIKPENPGFDPKPLFKNTASIDMYGRNWIIEIQSDKSFRTANKDSKPLIILWSGILIEGLLIGAFSMLAQANRRAVKFASKLAQTHESNALQLSNIIENAVDGLIQLDSHGKIIAFNKACSEIFGYSADEALGLNVNSLVPNLIPWKTKFDGKHSEHIGLRKDGSEFTLDFSATLMLIQGKQILSGIIRDISERKQAEADIQKTMEDLKLSNDDLEKFAYIASHDLKSPLRAIDNLSAWLDQDIRDKIDDDSKMKLDTLRGRVARMERLLDDLLQYSRAANKAYPVERIQAYGLVSNIVDTLHIPENLNVQIDENLTGMDVARMPIEQVFHNLISNAVKHHDKEDGSIKISGRQVDDHFEFSIADDGPGISPDYHERIFEMFQTLRRRDEVEASGIGLAVVKKIIHRYGGTIRVESEPGQGSKFIFTWKQTLEMPRQAA